MRSKPLWIVRASPIREQDLMSELVRSPEDRILCVGGFGSPFLDPSPVFLSTLVKRKHVEVLDAKDLDLRKKLLDLALKKQGIPRTRLKDVARPLFTDVRGAGGLSSFRKELAEWKNREKKKNPSLNHVPILRDSKVITLRPGNALKLGLINTHDLVIDRGTAEFISLAGAFPAVERAANEYLNAVTRNGSVAFLVDSTSNYRMLQTILEGMQLKTPFNVEEVNLRNPETPYDGVLPYHGYNYVKALILSKPSQHSYS